MGAEYLSYVKSIATFAPTFYGYIISVLVSVWRHAKTDTVAFLFSKCLGFLVFHGGTEDYSYSVKGVDHT